MKKNILLGFISFSIVFSTMFNAVHAEEEEKEKPDLAENAKSAILMERDTGKILYDKNEHEKLPPASMTKIMTLLIIMEEIDKGHLKLQEKVRVSERASSMGGSQIFLAEGEEMTVEDLVKGIAIASGNDASVAMAEKISGSEEAFVDRMNEKAKALNLKNTKFQNASGLPAEDHYSTAHDMAIISKELLKYEDITEYTSIYEDYLRKGEENEFWLVNTNKLVKFYPGVDGLKTGYTNEAKYCLTATAKKDDMRVIAVVMGSDTVKERNAVISQMLDYAFNQFTTKKLHVKGETVENLQLLKAENKSVDIVTSESISTLHPKGESVDDVETDVVLHSDFTLPIKKGSEVGTLLVKQGEKVLTESPLIIDDDIDKASLYTLFKRSAQYLARNHSFR